MAPIEWLARSGTKPESWNPVRGCSLVSEGCRSCYAMKQAHRFSGPGKPYEGLTEIGPQGPRWTGRVVCDAEKLLLPRTWRTPRTVFVNSMSDLFHEVVPDAFIDRVFAVMALCPQHTFIVLTKRPERLRTYLGDGSGPNVIRWVGKDGTYDRIKLAAESMMGATDGRAVPWPLQNCYPGVSVEDQATADERIPLLLQTPAALRVVSVEPLLGPADLEPFFRDQLQPGHVWRDCVCSEIDPSDRPCVVCMAKLGLDWVIVGGESGPKARPCDVAWLRSIVSQCRDAAVPVFVKQLGRHPRVSPGRQQHWDWGGDIGVDREGKLFTQDGDHWRLHLRSPKGADPQEWIRGLRVREFPAVRT